jgi:hypothetical protein
VICSFALLLAVAGIHRVDAAESDWDKDSTACAAVGIDPGSAVFSQCVADLHHSLWAEQNMYDS